MSKVHFISDIVLMGALLVSLYGNIKAVAIQSKVVDYVKLQFGTIQQWMDLINKDIEELQKKMGLE